jgi:hypothetical protein
MSTTGRSLLAPPEAAAQSRPLRCWGASERQRIAGAVEELLGRWWAAWGLTAPAAAAAPAKERDLATVRVDPWPGTSAEAASLDPASWRLVDEGAWGIWCAALTAAEPAARGASRARAAVMALARALVGDAAQLRDAGLDSATTITAELALAAWTDLCGKLTTALRPAGAAAPARAPAPPTDGDLRPWSGSVLVTLPWWGHRLGVLLAGDRVASFLAAGGAPARPPHDRPSVPLTPIWRALRGEHARVRVVTAPFELDLGVLTSLRPGHVVLTSHAVDEPLHVSVARPDGRIDAPILRAYLGKARGARAVELVRRPLAASSPSGTERRSS